jgi:hypothetical protein
VGEAIQSDTTALRAVPVKLAIALSRCRYGCWAKVHRDYVMELGEVHDPH